MSKRTQEALQTTMRYNVAIQAAAVGSPLELRVRHCLYPKLDKLGIRNG